VSGANCKTTGEKHLWHKKRASYFLMNKKSATIFWSRQNSCPSVARSPQKILKNSNLNKSFDYWTGKQSRVSDNENPRFQNAQHYSTRFCGFCAVVLNTALHPPTFVGNSCRALFVRKPTRYCFGRCAITFNAWFTRSFVSNFIAHRSDKREIGLIAYIASMAERHACWRNNILS